MLSFVVLGLGKFGESVAKTLYDMGYEVLAIDKSEDIVNDVADSVTQAVVGDVTDESLLNSLGVRNFDAAVLSIGNDLHTSILSALILKEIGVKYIVAKSNNDIQARALYKLGVDKVIFPERDMGTRVAKNLVAPKEANNLLDLSSDYSISEIPVPDSWDGKTIGELNIRAKYKINIIAIKKGFKVDSLPTPETVLKSDQVLIIAGSNDALRELLTKKL